MKKSILMLAAHYPSLDPRILWEATSASKEFETIVWGLGGAGLHSDEKNKKYSEVLLGRTKASVTQRRAFLLWCVKKDSWTILPIFAYVVLRLVHISAWFLFRALVNIKQEWKKLRLMQYWGRAGVGSECGSSDGGKCAKDDDCRALESSAIGHDDEFKQFVKNIISKFESYSLIKNIIMSYWVGRHILFFSESCLYYFSKKNKNNFDIYHCNDFDTLLAGLYLKDKYGGVVVYDAHEFWPHSLTTTPKSKNKFFLKLEGSFIRYADVVITVNPLLAEQIAKAYKLPHVESILNAEPWVQRSYRQTLNEKLVFLYQGNFAPDRGLEEVVKAWSKLSPVNAVLKLRGPDSESKTALIQFVNKLGCDSIEFVPAVSEDDLVEAAMEADVGIIPYKPVNINYEYCCPNKLSQYLHAGLAVVTNDLKYVSNVVQEFDVGYVYSSEDIDRMTKVFEQILFNRDDLLVKRHNAIDVAHDCFNWEVEENKLLNIYKRVLN